MNALQLENLKKILKCFDMCTLKANISIVDVMGFTTTLQKYGSTIQELEKEMSAPKHLPEVVEDKPKEAAKKK